MKHSETAFGCGLTCVFLEWRRWCVGKLLEQQQVKTLKYRFRV